MKLNAIAFDTGGTVLDWHGGVIAKLAALAAEHGWESKDWHALANDWRKRTIQGIIAQQRPAFHMDDVHRSTLDEALDAAGLSVVTQAAREDIWRTWHALDTWPGFSAALARLKQRLPVVSFTMLPTALVIDVSRRNRIDWDAIISCEMIGSYKPNPKAYETAARWLHLPPAEILMVACHNFDLNAAQAAGYRTAFVRRPDEWGPAGPPDPEPNMNYDFIVNDFASLADAVLARISVS